MKYLMIPLAAALLASPGAYAACSAADVEAAAERLAERVAQLTENDPERAAEINEQLKEMDAKRTADELGDECQAYERRLQHIEQAEKEADIPSNQER
ncbi:hypothetical protein [Stutzerimonas nitrititolerans]|uniref:hypothetical protein n=1 Tax=Stutzerimonas nitrititolerans TaxID=2482751 RepID=UPI0028AE7EA7|nr:hypothetical protein [Stutzerimonas nitrititolerans]